MCFDNYTEPFVVLCRTSFFIFCFQHRFTWCVNATVSLTIDGNEIRCKNHQISKISDFKKCHRDFFIEKKKVFVFFYHYTSFPISESFIAQLLHLAERSRFSCWNPLILAKCWFFRRSVHNIADFFLNRSKNLVFLYTFSKCCQNYTLEWFSEAGSAPIRSAVKFPFDIDVRFFPNCLKKYIFSVDQKEKVENFPINIFHQLFFFVKWISSRLTRFTLQRKIAGEIYWLENFRLFPFDRPKKHFFETVGKKSDINVEWKFHCGANGSTPSLWKQKTTLKYSSDSILKMCTKKLIFPGFYYD